MRNNSNIEKIVISCNSRERFFVSVRNYEVGHVLCLENRNELLYLYDIYRVVYGTAPKSKPVRRICYVRELKVNWQDKR